MNMHVSKPDRLAGRTGIGQSLPRKEDATLVRGEGRYTDDLSLDGQLYAAFVRSPHAHGIIRGIDTSPDKQQILRNVVAYAHPRSMKIVAEGVETAAELCTVIELGADLLQGYFLARPAIVPGAIAPEAAGIIQELQRRKKD